MPRGAQRSAVRSAPLLACQQTFGRGVDNLKTGADIDKLNRLVQIFRAAALQMAAVRVCVTKIDLREVRGKYEQHDKYSRLTPASRED